MLFISGRQVVVPPIPMPMAMVLHTMICQAAAVWPTQVPWHLLV